MLNDSCTDCNQVMSTSVPFCIAEGEGVHLQKIEGRMVEKKKRRKNGCFMVR